MLNPPNPLVSAVPAVSFLGIGHLRFPPSHLDHVLDILLELRSLPEDILDMMQPEPLVAFTLRDRSSREQHIADLAPVQFFERGAFALFVVVGPVQQLLLVVRVVVVQLVDEAFVDVVLLFVIEVLVSDGEVDTRLHCYVKGPDSVRGENQNSVVVF